MIGYRDGKVSSAIRSAIIIHRVTLVEDLVVFGGVPSSLLHLQSSLFCIYLRWEAERMCVIDQPHVPLTGSEHNDIFQSPGRDSATMPPASADLTSAA